MKLALSRGYRSGNHRLYGVIVTTSKRQFFIGIKCKGQP